jgi:predicted permease
MEPLSSTTTQIAPEDPGFILVFRGVSQPMGYMTYQMCISLTDNARLSWNIRELCINHG